jgi:hypothetical protein
MPPERFPDWLSDWKKRRAGQQIAAGVPAKRSRDITLRTAIESHRKWVEDVVGYLHAPEGSAPPVLDSRQCRFGLWYHGTGMIRYGNLAAFAEIEPVHEKIHDLARELVAQAHQGQAAGTPARMPELQRLSDRLVARLQDLIEILERAIPPPPAA